MTWKLLVNFRSGKVANKFIRDIWSKITIKPC